MNLSSTTRYAIRILSFMAHQKMELVSAKFLIQSLGISDKYLRSLMTQLTKRGIIRSVQGRDGGYMITKAHNELYLIDIIEALGDTEKYTGCILGFDECLDENPCALHLKWIEIKKDTENFLRTTTLEDIVMNKHIHKF